MKLFITVPLLLLDHAVAVYAQTKKKEGINNRKIKCENVADFYYEIVMGVTSFPPQGPCSDKEEAEIAALLQKSINTELHAEPGTIQTKNTVCSNAVNTQRRRRLSDDHWAIAGNTRMGADEPDELWGSFLRWPVHLRSGKQNGKSILRRRLYRRRSFIYVGGGKCRYCLHDNSDKRTLVRLPHPPSPSTYFKSKAFPSENNIITSNKHDRHLLKRSADDNGGDVRNEIQIVPDARLCESRESDQFFFNSFNAGIFDRRWKNGKAFDMGKKSPFGSFLGPYIPGDTFGIVLKGIGNTEKDEKPESTSPVLAATIEFDLWEIDIPDQFAKKFWGNDSLYLFINGIKIDLGLLITAPNARSRANDNDPNDNESDEELLDLEPPDDGENEYRYGKSFAGIGWSVVEAKVPQKNYGFGPQVDRRYKVELYVPKIIFDHTNEMEMQFFISRNSKAKQFGIDDFLVMVETPVDCKITGLKESPFDVFKAVMERKLRDQLGLDVAREFQSKAEHCLKDRIPVVDIHLVEKEKWTEANPRCKHN